MPAASQRESRAGHGHKGNKITLTVRHSDFTTFSRQATLPFSTNDTGEIYKAAIGILDKTRLKSRVRLLGVGLSGIEKGADQMSLFGEKGREKKAAVAKAVDKLNEKFGERTVTFAAVLTDEEKKEQRVISPSWRPSGVRKSDK